MGIATLTKGRTVLANPFTSSRSKKLVIKPRTVSRVPPRKNKTIHVLFTGIVQGKAKVKTVQEAGHFKTVELEFPDDALGGIALGASVAVNGTCLTVTSHKNSSASFDIIEETLSRTNLGDLSPGQLVNFERAARFGDEIGGHHVSGHICTTARIVDDVVAENNRRLELELLDPSWIKYVMPKGFITVDGCSLTVGEVFPKTFSLYLIPETLRVTVLGLKGKGDVVNVEIDAQTQSIVDTVERYMHKIVGPQVT